MPTIEHIATHLHGVKVFSVLNTKNGFWHSKLDEELSNHHFSYTVWSLSMV